MTHLEYLKDRLFGRPAYQAGDVIKWGTGRVDAVRWSGIFWTLKPCGFWFVNSGDISYSKGMAELSEERTK